MGLGAMDTLTALRLQIEWGADEALLDAPLNRLDHVAPPPASAPIAPPARVASPVVRGLDMEPAAALAARLAAASPDMAALHRALDGFHACPLRATASMTVAPSGNPAAGLVLVGEAPGRDDDRSGQAYDGAAGAALDRVLGSAGLGRDAALLTFLVPWRPPGGREPNEAEIAACLPFLHRALALLRPRHVVMLGTGPLRALMGGGTMRQARGRWATVEVPGLGPVPALPMLAPDLWLKTAASRQNTWADLLSLRAARDEQPPTD